MSNLLKGRCRVCKQELFKEPSLQLKEMPKSAQNFPKKSELDSEKGSDLDIYECASCGLIQLNSEPVFYHKDVIRAVAYSPEMREFRLKQFKLFLQRYNLKGKKLLEVGCGKGEYLSLMKSCGAITYGIEHLQESVDVCVGEGLDVTKAYIDQEHYTNIDAPFDGFFILNFLEHIPDINTVLKGVLNNLSEGAIGLIEVPNFDMIIKNNLFSEFIPDHLYYFTQETLRRTLELNGFEILESQTIWYDYIISTTVRRRKKIDISNFYKQQSRLEEELHSYLDENKKTVIWGAGHQALAVIALTKIKDKVKYIVDSADFKQGFYSPSTHLEILSPKILLKGDIDAVIVMAASYSDEIAAIIERDYSISNIAILRDYGLEIVK